MLATLGDSLEFDERPLPLVPLEMGFGLEPLGIRGAVLGIVVAGRWGTPFCWEGA